MTDKIKGKIINLLIDVAFIFMILCMVTIIIICMQLSYKMDRLSLEVHAAMTVQAINSENEPPDEMLERAMVEKLPKNLTVIYKRKENK